MHNPSERNFCRDLENGPDVYLENSKRDQAINSYVSRVNNLLRRERDLLVTSYASRVNNLLHTGRYQSVTSPASRVNDFLATKKDEPINFSATGVASVMESLTASHLAGMRKRKVRKVSIPSLLHIRKGTRKRSIQTNTEKVKEKHRRELSLTAENIRAQSDEDVVSPMGNTVMHIAALCRDDEWVEELAKNKSHLLAKKNCNGDTPLHVAARFRHKNTLEKLLVALVRNLHPPYPEKLKEALDEILVKNKQGNTFFHEAVLNGQTDIMNILDKILDNQELHIEHGFKELVERAALFWTNKEEKSILHVAIEEGYEDTVVDALDRLSQHHALDELIQNHQELSQIIWEAEPPFPRQDQENGTTKTGKT